MNNPHPLAFKTGIEERLVWIFSLRQFCWLLIGAVLSWKLAKILPPLPLPFPANWLHCFVPFFVTAVLAYARENRTGLRVSHYIVLWWQFRRRQRNLVYRR